MIRDDERALQSLVERGFDEADARTRLVLIAGAVRRHEVVVGRAPAWTWFVPGRIEIFGKHTDYAGGRSLLAAVPRGFAVAASPRADAIVRVATVRSGEIGRIGTNGRIDGTADGLPYIAAVVRRLRQNFPGALLGADLTIDSDLPRAAGLSSSSALVVGAAAALIRRGRIDERPEWRSAIATSYDVAAYLGALERGAAFRTLEGALAVGVFGGSEDHTAILTCQPGRVSACRYVPVEPLGDAPMPSEWRFVMATSGVEADKGAGARELYNRASLSAEALLTLWNRHSGAVHGSLAAALDSSPHAEARLTALANEHGAPPFTGEWLVRRLRHFVAEDGSIPRALRAFEDADAAALGELARGSQRDAEDLLGNQTSETTALARLAFDAGAFAACSFGAGFGGSVWALAPADDAEAIGRRWLSAYRHQYPRLTAASAFVARPGPALFEV